MLAKRRCRAEVAFADADGVGWVVRAQWRRMVVLGLDGKCRAMSRELVLFFTSEFGDMRRGADPVTDQWVTMSEDELRARCERAFRIGRGPGMVAP